MTKFCNDRAHALLGVFVVVLGLLSVVAFRALDAADVAQESQRKYQELACERGNVLRAYIIIDVGFSQNEPVKRQDAALRFFPLVNCAGAGINPMSPVMREQYLSDKASLLGLSSWRAREPSVPTE